jgi:hypothetical protein
MRARGRTPSGSSSSWRSSTRKPSRS